MIRTNNRRAHRAGLAAVATLVMSFAVAFLALSSAPADAATTAAAPAASVPSFVPRTLAATVHGPGPYSAITDECATCHRVHTGKNRNLLKSSAPQSTLCFTCHNSALVGASTDVQTPYTNAPLNDGPNRVYYQHNALVTTSHTFAADATDPQGVANRHSECGDCHNPHKSSSTNSTQTATGWTASGRLAGISGVSVSNSPTPDQPPTSYTFRNGTTSPITFEYQLCFKCHSGFTTQLPDIAGKPSRDRLDKAAEFNPNNPSFHPVEAPGKNTSPAMALSLSGFSPYRQWTFAVGDTIRCSNCHASPAKLTPAPPAGGDLPPHTSPNPGILLAPYRNRILKPVGEAFNPAEFKLCFMCHAIGPFDGTDSKATNWSKHDGHLRTRTGTNTGGQDIDTAAANGGNAICAECHYRIHSTTFKQGTQSITGGRGMVNFSPNVGPGATWNGSGCSNFTCHGKSH